MRIRISLLSLLFSLLTAGFLVSNTQTATAGCRDYPESVTPACAAQNLAEEQTRQAAAEVQRAQDLIDAENRAKEQAARDYVANGSRPCSVFPASITPACAAQNLDYEAGKQAAAAEQQVKDQIKVEEAAKANAELEYVRNGSRPCSVYPASITPECAAQNLDYEAGKQAAAAEQQVKDQIKVEEVAKANAELEYIRNGSRPCSVYPASITTACATENLEYETKRQVAAVAQLAQDVIAAEEKLSLIHI